MFDDADKFLKIAVGLGVLAAGAGIGYHYGVYIPQIEREKIERVAQAARDRQDAVLKRETKRKERYDTCLGEASSAYLADWESACKLAGKGKECSLVIPTADRLGKRFDAAKQMCLEEFKSGI